MQFKVKLVSAPTLGQSIVHFLDDQRNSINASPPMPSAGSAATIDSPGIRGFFTLDYMGDRGVWERYALSAAIVPQQGATYIWDVGTGSVDMETAEIALPGVGDIGGGFRQVVTWVQKNPVWAGAGAVGVYFLFFRKRKRGGLF